MEPLTATMDQSSIGNNTNTNLSSGPNTTTTTKELHKTDQSSSSAASTTLSPSSSKVAEPLSDDESATKQNRLAKENYHCSSNHRETTREHDDLRSHDLKKLHDNDDYDDNKDVVVVELNKSTDKSLLNSNIAKTTENVSLEEGVRRNPGNQESEGTPSYNKTAPNSTELNRSETTSPAITTTTTTTPTSCTDILPKSRDLSEACHHQPTSCSSLSSASDSSQNAAALNGGESVNHKPPETSSTLQQRRQPPIIKAQSLDFSCDDDSTVQIPSHFQTNHYLFQNNHHHSHRLPHSHHHHHHSHHEAHNPSPSASSTSSSPASSSAKNERTLNKGCSLDTQRSEEDEERSRRTGIAGTLTTEDVDADVDEDDDEESAIKRAPVLIANSQRGSSLGREVPPSQIQQRPRGSFDSATSTTETMDSAQQTDAVRLSSPHPRQHSLAKGVLPKVQSLESRPIYPNVPYSPYASPYGSPRSNRRRTPLRESRRISIEQSGSFLQLNQYKLMDQIGQGSYGLVKLAYSEEDSTHYAMKILSKRRLLRKAGLMSRGPKKTTSPLDRVYREIAVLKKLDHPNVVKLIEVLDDPLEDSLYLVFELVKQGEVLSIPTDTPLTEERAWSVFRDAVQGLEYLHYQRIIHADIKPGNLLLTECGHVKIADLGVCNEFLGEDATMNNGSTAGTPAFRAPETLFPGQHLYSGKAADIWALGATLYSLVYGNVPFVASSVPLLYEKIKNEALMIPEKPTVSEELVDLIRKMLTKDPPKRITLPQIKEHPWVTSNGTHILPSEDDNCRLVQVSEEDINSVVKSIPKLDTLILIKTMLKNHSFLNPFSRGVSGRAPQRGGSRLERFTRAGRSNSAPGAYHSPIDRQLSADCILPALSEHAVSSSNEIVEDI